MIDDADNFQDDNSDAPRPTDEQVAEATELADKLVAAAQKIGLYAQGADLGFVPDPDGDHRLLIMTEFVFGDVAWSNRIQNPEEADIDAEFRAIRSTMEAEEYEEYKRKLAKELDLDDGNQ